jgi:predicted acetyltransferase
MPSVDPPGIELRPSSEDEWPAFVRASELAFHSVPREVEYDIFRIGWPFERSVAAYDGDAIVGTAGAFDFELTVPGGSTVPTAGVTAVGVAPTHRRRGVLTAMLLRQFADYHATGVPVAALWASESIIYGRFGYGLAAWSLFLDVPRTANAFRPDAPAPSGRIRLVDPQSDEARKVIAAIDDATRRSQPGRFARDADWLRRTVADPEHWRDGAGPLQLAVHEGSDGVDGYLLYRVTPRFESGLPAGTVDVSGLDALDPAAYVSLWRYALEIDLVASTRARNRPADDPLLTLLADPRRAQPRLRDNLYVRLVDVPTALAARSYSRPVDVVVEVRDPLCPWNEGRYRLAGDSTGARCEPTTDAADLTATSTALGAAYLGGTTLRALAGAGSVSESRPEALAATSAAFHGDVAPYCPEVF